MDSKDGPSVTAISSFVKWKERETFIFIPSQHMVLQTGGTVTGQVIVAPERHGFYRYYTLRMFTKLKAPSARQSQ